MGTIEKHKGKKYCMAVDYMVDKALDNIKEKRGIRKFDILIFWTNANCQMTLLWKNLWY